MLSLFRNTPLFIFSKSKLTPRTRKDTSITPCAIFEPPRRACDIWTQNKFKGETTTISVHLTLTLIGRRSRLYAGARLLKRGLNEAGHVANEVEAEQIVGDGGRGALHERGLTSAVQLRGSIPLVWNHPLDKTIVVPRPDIHLQRIDPSFE